MWKTIDEKWEPNRKVCLLYNYGSGAVLIETQEDGSVIDDSGDQGDLDLSDYSEWSYLPDDFLLWHERDEEAPALDPEVAAI